MQSTTFLVLALGLLMTGAIAAFPEDRLVAKLLEGLQPAGKIARPVANAGDNVSISLGLALLRVDDVEHGSAELDVWIKMSWKDPRLQWKPLDFGGLNRVALPFSSVWLPDIRPYSVAKYQPDKETASLVLVTSDSTVIYVLPAELKVHQCETLRNKSVTCNVSLGSWVYNGFQLDLQNRGPEAVDLSNFVENKWEVAGAEAVRNVKVYPCCSEPYVSIDYKLMLNKRKKDKSSKHSKKSSKSERSK